jgi:hypothetical protein
MKDKRKKARKARQAKRRGTGTYCAWAVPGKTSLAQLWHIGGVGR